MERCIAQEADPVCVAARNGDLERVASLLKAGCCATHPDTSDRVWCRQAIHHAAAKGHLTIVELLLKYGVHVNCVDGDLRTPLHWAATSGCVAVCSALLDRGASVNIAQKDGLTPLHAATILGDYAVCECLLQHNASLSRIDRDGWTPLHAAVEHSRPSLVNLYILHGADVHMKTGEGETSLHLAVQRGNDDIVMELLNAGADIESCNMQSFTPFYYAVWLDKLEIARLLVNMGAKVNVTNNIGHSTLHVAAVRADIKTMNLILMSGYDLHEESWIRCQQFPLAINEEPSLRQFFLDLIRNPLSLRILVVRVIRSSLKNNKTVSVCALPVPTLIKDYISLKDISETFLPL